MSLTIEHEPHGEDTSVIRLEGRLVLGPGCKELELLVPQLVNAGRRKLIFDMSGITHIDSTGMGRFIDTYQRLQKVGGDMKLAGASGTVRDVFRVTRLDRVFRFYDSVREASGGS